MVDDELADAVTTMRETKHFLNPPTKEKDLINKCFAVVHASKHKRTLYIAKFVTRFLADEDGPVDECLMRCLKPKIDSGTLLVDNPKHLPPDDGMFHSSQFIAGPLEAVYTKGSSHFLALDYENILHKFRLFNKEKENYF